jgi:hypothetical protein
MLDILPGGPIKGNKVILGSEGCRTPPSVKDLNFKKELAKILKERGITTGTVRPTQPTGSGGNEGGGLGKLVKGFIKRGGIVSFFLSGFELGGSEIEWINKQNEGLADVGKIQDLYEEIVSDPSLLSDEYLKGVRERVLNGSASETDKYYAEEASSRAAKGEVILH